MEKRYDKEYSKYSIENPEVYKYLQKPSKTEKEVKFLIKLFKKYGKIKTILDVGCGIGTHVKGFKELNYSIAGVDANHKMIEYAKVQYPNFDFSVQYMQTLKLKKKFDAIINLANVIAFNETNQEVLKTFQNFNKHLNKGGLLIVDTLNPINYITKKNFKEKFEDIGEERVAFGVKAIYNEKINISKQTLISIRTYYSLKTNKKLGEYSKESRLYFPQEIKFFLEQAGFNVLNFYGGSIEKMTLDSTNLDKNRMLIAAKKL